MVVLEKFRDWPVFSFKDVEKLVGKSYAKLIIHNYLSSGKIHKLGKGIYSFHDDPVLAVYAFRPSYLGLEFALSFYEVWEQETVPVVITSRRVRLGVRQVLDKNVLIRYMKPKGMFGYESKRYGDFYIPVSTPEKTLVDFVYYNEPVYENAFDSLVSLCDMKIVRNYLKRIGLRKKAKFKDARDLVRLVF